jgi:hypothetical protein
VENPQLFPWAERHPWQSWKFHYCNNETELERQIQIIASFTPDKFKDGHGKVVAYQRASSVSSIDIRLSSSSSSDEMDDVQGTVHSGSFWRLTDYSVAPSNRRTGSPVQAADESGSETGLVSSVYMHIYFIEAKLATPNGCGLDHLSSPLPSPLRANRMVIVSIIQRICECTSCFRDFAYPAGLVNCGPRALKKPSTPQTLPAAVDHLHRVNLLEAVPMYEVAVGIPLQSIPLCQAKTFRHVSKKRK